MICLIPQECKYKNYLQEYTQREGLLLPSYHTVWDGASHSPMFRSTVVVNGVTYSSPNVFPTRKAAEMDVAGIALRGLLQLQQAEDCSIDKEVLHGKSLGFNLFVFIIDIHWV